MPKLQNELNNHAIVICILKLKIIDNPIQNL